MLLSILIGTNRTIEENESMEYLLGGWSDSRDFDAYFRDWEGILNRRVDESIVVFSGVDGLCGLVLAGSVGRGMAWPLSDIDYLAIYDDDRLAEGKEEVARRSDALQARWLHDGWWTGLDIGKLAFGRNEVARVMEMGVAELPDLLSDLRWYYSLDKGFQSRSVFDDDARAADLASWLTVHRFSPAVVAIRLARERGEVNRALQQVQASLDRGDLVSATKAARIAAQWLTIWLLEQWGERDASFGRVGTHFERVAIRHERLDLVDLVNLLQDLDADAVARRLAIAPQWVREWHDVAWRARRSVRESVTPLQHARDTLRVCSHFELRRSVGDIYPEWLAVPGHRDLLEEIATTVTVQDGVIM